MASAAPHFSAKTHSDEPSPIQLLNATSNNCTKIRPTSFRTHSSKMVQRNLPYCFASTLHSVTGERAAFFCFRSGGAEKSKPKQLRLGRGPAFHQWNKLNELTADLSEKAIYGQRLQ